MAHYGKSLKTDRLLDWSVIVAADFIEKLDEYIGYRPVLCYRGMSGVTHATALALELTRRKIRFFHCYVRKEGETSHGNKVECNVDYTKKIILVFVDDFVATGATRKAVLTNAVEYMKRNEIDFNTTDYIEIESDCNMVNVYNLTGFMNV